MRHDDAIGHGGQHGTNQRKSAVAAAAPTVCPTRKPGTSTGRIPANVFVSARASVTAGLANDVDAVNQYAAVMYAPTANGTASGRRRAHPQITESRPNVATASLRIWGNPLLACCDHEYTGSPNMASASATPTSAPTICATAEVMSSSRAFAASSTHAARFIHAVTIQRRAGLIGASVSRTSPFGRRMQTCRRSVLLGRIAPRRERARERSRSGDLDRFGAQYGAHSISPKCQRANATGSLTTTMRSSSPPDTLADLASPFSIRASSDCRAPRGRVVEANEHATSRQAFTDEIKRRPCPQNDARMRLLGLQLHPLGSPSLERQHDFRQLASRLGRFIRGAGPIRPAPISITPACSSSFKRVESRPRDSPGAPSAISLNDRHRPERCSAE